MQYTIYSVGSDVRLRFKMFLNPYWFADAREIIFLSLSMAQVPTSESPDSKFSPRSVKRTWAGVPQHKAIPVWIWFSHLAVSGSSHKPGPELAYFDPLSVRSKWRPLLRLHTPYLGGVFSGRENGWDCSTYLPVRKLIRSREKRNTKIYHVKETKCALTLADSRKTGL